MRNESITAPKGTKYVSDLLDRLVFTDRFNDKDFARCILDKGKTGCGGTHVAITNEYHSLIAMPYKNLVYNKMMQHKDLLGVTGDTRDKEIVRYIHEHRDRLKIATTYNSINRVIKLLQENGVDPRSEMDLLVDEAHVLTNSYLFRMNAIKKLITTCQQFDRVTYMTATPVDRDFLLEELIDLPVVRIEWEEPELTGIRSIYAKDLIHATVGLIELERGDSNLHLFVNSVDFIGKVIKAGNLSPDDVRVVCSTESQGRGKKSNQSKLGSSYLIEDTTTPVKKINFYTSTAFEGCDIYDRKGKTYIITDIHRNHTLLDMGTLFIQVAGRIRNSIYRGDITHLYNTNQYRNEVSFEEFERATNNQISASKSFVNEINRMTEDNRIPVIKSLMQTGFDGKYITWDDQTYLLKYDPNLLKMDVRNFKLTNHDYTSLESVQEEYRKRGLMLNSQYEAIVKEAEKEEKKPSKPRSSFKDLFIEYADLKRTGSMMLCCGEQTDRATMIEQENPLVKQAFYKIGEDRVKKLNYNVTSIKRELIKSSLVSEGDKIVKSLHQKGYTDTGTVKTTIEIRNDLNDIYSFLGIDRKPVATDLTNWFEIEEVTRKINDKSTSCYKIIRRKVIYTE